MLERDGIQLLTIGVDGCGATLCWCAVPHRYLDTFLAQHLFTGVGNFLARWERLTAPGARETLLVVGFTQGSDHLKKKQNKHS